MKKVLLSGIIVSVFLISIVTYGIASAQENNIPSWIKNTAGWWSEGTVSDSDFINSMHWLIENDVLDVSTTEDDEFQLAELKQEVAQLKKENSQLKNQIRDLEADVELYEIFIVGDYSCKNKTNQALELLQSKAKNHYEIITTYVGIIECVDEGSGMLVWDTPPRFLAGKETVDKGTIWYAGTIAHDSCHSKLYSDYLKNNPQSNSVPSDIYTGGNAEAECLAFQYDTLVLIGSTQYFLNYVKNIIESEYWEIPLEDRWW